MARRHAAMGTVLSFETDKVLKNNALTDVLKLLFLAAQTYS
jgi:hypothetical protein